MTTSTPGEHLSSNYPAEGEQAATALTPAESGEHLPAQPTAPPRPTTAPGETSLNSLLDQSSTEEAADESGSDIRQSHRFRNVALALALVASVGGGIAYAAHGKDKPSPRPAAGSTPHPGAPSHATASEPTPSTSPTESAPYDGTEPTLGGKYYSAGKYDATTPVAVPYVAGQKPTKAIVETLLRNVDVAITSDDVNQLLYAGIEPGSELARTIQAQQMVSFESNLQQARALTHVFSETLDDRDIKFDANDPNHAEALVRNGSDFDINYAPDRVSYDHLDLRLGHKVETLPDGQTEDIWRIQYQLTSKSTFDKWLVGYQQ